MADIYHAEMADAVAAGAQIVELDDLIFLAPQESGSSTSRSSIASSDGIDAYKIWHLLSRRNAGAGRIAPYEAMFPYVKDLQVDSFDWSFAQTGYPEAQLNCSPATGSTRTSASG